MGAKTKRLNWTFVMLFFFLVYNYVLSLNWRKDFILNKPFKWSNTGVKGTNTKNTVQMDRGGVYYAAGTVYRKFPRTFFTLKLGHRLNPMWKPRIQADYSCHPLQRSKLQTFQRHLSSLRGASVWYWKHNFLAEPSFNLPNTQYPGIPKEKEKKKNVVETC